MRRSKFGRNDGQTLVEFALVLPIFMLVIMTVLEFGRAITYWHDLNNSAQVAARYAVVNRYPGIPPAAPCPANCPSGGFLAWAKSDLNSASLAGNTQVSICYRDDDGSNTASAGDPITVTMTSTFKPFKFIKQSDITLRGKATLRMEQNNPDHIEITDQC